MSLIIRDSRDKNSKQSENSSKHSLKGLPVTVRVAMDIQEGLEIT